MRYKISIMVFFNSKLFQRIQIFLLRFGRTGKKDWLECVHSTDGLECVHCTLYKYLVGECTLYGLVGECVQCTLYISWEGRGVGLLLRIVSRCRDGTEGYGSRLEGL